MKSRYLQQGMYAAVFTVAAAQVNIIEYRIAIAIFGEKIAIRLFSKIVQPYPKPTRLHVNN